MASDLDLYIGARIRRRRIILELSQRHVAEAIGVRFQQVQKYECGDNRIYLEQLWKIAVVLEVEITYFMDGFEEYVLSKGREVLPSIQALRRSFARKHSVGLIHDYMELDQTSQEKVREFMRTLRTKPDATARA